MQDKFKAYYENNPEKKKEFVQYVHLNFRLISTKMISEMRRKLDLTPDLSNQGGYLSLLVNVHAKLLEEVVFSAAGICQSLGIKGDSFINESCLKVFLDLWEGNNPLNGRIRTDVKEDLEGFKKYYSQNIDELRSDEGCLPR